MGLVLRQGMAPVAAGLVLGLALAWVGTRLLGSLLYGVSTNDPTTFVFVPAFLAVIALLATLLPARRATQLSPTVALREE
jgi:ABC-type antimicrobial peptide transport system permease subunit